MCDQCPGKFVSPWTLLSCGDDASSVLDGWKWRFKRVPARIHELHAPYFGSYQFIYTGNLGYLQVPLMVRSQSICLEL